MVNLALFPDAGACAGPEAADATEAESAASAPQPAGNVHVGAVVSEAAEETFSGALSRIAIGADGCGGVSPHRKNATCLCKAFSS